MQLSIKTMKLPVTYYGLSTFDQDVLYYNNASTTYSILNEELFNI